MSAGRYAPSPSGDLHFGNLRTALLAWLFARQTGREFIMRIEDVDSQRSSAESAARQLDDLASLGLDWDGQPVVQSSRHEAYQAALSQLETYECFCSRRDILEASGAAHVLPGCYPGTCRELTEQERESRRQQFAEQGRVPAVRLRSDVEEFKVVDYYNGRYVGPVDDFVLRRGDWAYNLAVVVDDAAGGIDQVVRGDDLLSSAPRQAYLASLLGYAVPEYVHVPLVVNAEGKRLAKRDGAVTLRQMLEQGLTVGDVVEQLAGSIGVPGARTAAEILERFDPQLLPRDAYVWTQL